MPGPDPQMLANDAVAHLHAALTTAGVPDRAIGAALLSALIAVAKGDPDHWISQLYGAGVVIARNAPAQEAN